MKIRLNCLKSRFTVFLHDLAVIPIAWFAAHWLRFNLGEIPYYIRHQAEIVLPTLILIQVIFYWIFGLYRGIWRYASLPDLIRICKAVFFGVLATIPVLFLGNELVKLPRSAFPLYGLLLIMMLGGSRFLYRWSRDRGVGQGKRILIIGAGQTGEGLARDLLRDDTKSYRVVGFVDDRPLKQGQEIHNIRVLGKTHEIVSLVKRLNIELIFIAIPSATSAEMRRIVSYCEESGVPFRTLPSLADLANGSVRIDALRKVSLEDLLGRDPVILDWLGIKEGIENKSILVSGGGGSIGSELCRQIAQLQPEKLIVIEQNEFNLYSLTQELNQKFPGLNFFGCLLDVTDRIAVRRLLQQHPVSTIFHAAAYKHVPMLEQQLRAAVRNNIIGTQVLAEEAVNFDVAKFVLISTDKAVHPTNVMGSSKRAAEIFCQNYNAHSQTKFITVRFGNVLGSAGSVVPLFRQQIEQGGPITVTHPDITRFFMTIPEATQLILQAMAMGRGGEIFVLDMGEPIKISYLAEQMILLAGLVPNEDIEIIYTGLRPGEKLFEELFYATETLMATTHEKIMQASYQQQNWLELLEILQEMNRACAIADENLLRRLLERLVPEYNNHLHSQFKLEEV